MYFGEVGARVEVEVDVGTCARRALVRDTAGRVPSPQPAQERERHRRRRRRPPRAPRTVASRRRSVRGRASPMSGVDAHAQRASRRAATSPTWPPATSRSAVERASAGSTTRPRAVAARRPRRTPAAPRRPGDSSTALLVPGTRATTLRAGCRRASSSRAGVRGDDADRRPAYGRRSTSCPCGPRAGAVHAFVQPGRRVARVERRYQLGRRGRRVLGPERAQHAAKRGRGAQPEYQRVRATLRPLGPRQEPHGGLGHRVRRGIGGGVGAARPCRTRSRPRGIPAIARSCWRTCLATLRRHARQRRRHEQQVAFVDARARTRRPGERAMRQAERSPPARRSTRVSTGRVSAKCTNGR